MRRQLSVKKYFSFHRAILLAWTFLAICSFAPSVLAADAQTAEDPKQQLRQAQKLVRRGEFSEAEKILRRVLAVNPQNSECKLALAFALLKQKQIVAAYEQSLAVAQAEPKNAHAFAVLGAVYLAAGNFAEARFLVNTANSLDKRNALAWATIGTVNFYENHLDLSILELRNAVRLDPREPDYIYILAQVATRAENYIEASAAYRKYLDIAPIADKDRRERIKGLISFLNFLGTRQSLYNVSGIEKSRIPFSLTNDRPLIELRINKKIRTSEIRSGYRRGNLRVVKKDGGKIGD